MHPYPFPDLTVWFQKHWPAWAAWLQTAWREGQAELADDLRELAEPVRQGVHRLPLDDTAVELRTGLAEMRAAVQEAAVILAEDGRLLAAAGARGLERATQTRAAQALRTAAAPAIPLAAAAWRQIRVRLEIARRWLAPRWAASRARLREWESALLPAARQAWRRWSRRPQFLHYLVIADGALAASIVATLAVSAPMVNDPALRQLPLLRPWAARPSVRQPAAALPTLVLPTATLLPTLAPSPTPLLTATPIPSLYTEWQSSLPEQGGWNGLAECWGGVLAPAGSGQFIWPTDKHYLVGWDYAYWHPGLDLGGDIGDPLYAADAGVVVYAGWNVYGFGNLVILDHGNGWHTLYAHMSEIHVTCGQSVEQGAVLGLAGSTGHSTGPHLHFEMRLSGSNVSPWDYLPAP